MIAAGLLFTEVLSTPGIDGADKDVVQWLVQYRTPDRTDLSFYGSEISGGIVIPIVVALVVLGFVVFRHWRAAAFLVAAIVLESATYRATVYFVDRERPDVPQGRRPSGRRELSVRPHCGLDRRVFRFGVAVDVTVYVDVRARARVDVALAVPVVVGVSRMYRACTIRSTSSRA